MHSPYCSDYAASVSIEIKSSEKEKLKALAESFMYFTTLIYCEKPLINWDYINP